MGENFRPLPFKFLLRDQILFQQRGQLLQADLWAGRRGCGGTEPLVLLDLALQRLLEDALQLVRCGCGLALANQHSRLTQGIGGAINLRKIELAAKGHHAQYLPQRQPAA